jgi:Fe-S-cluster containining protein
MTPEVRRQIDEVYRDVDAAIALASPRCDASGRCCRFVEFGHRLYISHFEAEILLEAAPPYVAPIGIEGCPFQIEQRCTAREPRPLGCRIFFCDPTHEELGNALTEAALHRLKQIADEQGLAWRYGPLHHFLNHPEDALAAPESPEVAQ